MNIVRAAQSAEARRLVTSTSSSPEPVSEVIAVRCTERMEEEPSVVTDSVDDEELYENFPFTD